MARILVTPRSVTKAGGHPSLDRIAKVGHEVVMSAAGRLPSEEELMDLLPACEGYLAGVEHISAEVLTKAEKLKVISRNGTGVDKVDLDAAAARGIKVCRAIGANARGVAELTMGYIFSLARSIPFSDAGLKQKEWARRKGVEVTGKTLGLIGCGAVGKLVAPMALGVGMTVRAHDVEHDPEFANKPGFDYEPLDNVISQSDFLSLHCPASPDCRPLLNAAKIAAMKGGAFIINTARHNLIDNRALSDAIGSGHIAGAAIDVFEEEPPQDYELVQNEHVVATPHIGGFTIESVDCAMEKAVENLLENLA